MVVGREQGGEDGIALLIRASRRCVLRFAAGAAAGAVAGRPGFMTPAFAQGAERHGISAFGELKYPADFRHFDYVAAEAPKGGLFSQIGSTFQFNQNPTTFNSLNSFIFKGVAALGMEMTFATLMTRAFDERDAMYGQAARAVRISDDGLVYRFVLRPGTLFHDGSELTAHDVAFSLNILKEKGHPQIRQYLRQMVAAEAADERTATVRFEPGRARDVPLFAAGLPIFSRVYYDKQPFDESTLDIPLGSGPYKVARFEANRFIEYERVRDWWGANLPTSRGRFNFDRVRYEFFRDRNVGFEGFKAKTYLFREEFTSRIWATRYEFPAIRDGRGPVRNLLPLLARNAERFGLGLAAEGRPGPHDRELAELLRAARFREELRARTVARIARQVLTALADAGLHPVVLGGLALVHTVYDDPADRHCGGIHLLLAGDEPGGAEGGAVRRSADAIARFDFRPSPARTPPGRPLRLAHATGLPLTLQDRLFDVPQVRGATAPSFAGSGLADAGSGPPTVPCQIAGLPARVLSPAAALLWTCVRAYFGGPGGPPAWAADAWMILRATPGPDWTDLLGLAERHRLRRPAGSMLAWLVERLDAPVPGEALDALRSPAGEDRTERRLAMLGAIHAARAAPASAWRRARGRSPDESGARWFALRSWLLPPGDYLRWRYGVRGPLLPLLWVWLPIRWLVRRAVGATGRDYTNAPYL